MELEIEGSGVLFTDVGAVEVVAVVEAELGVY